MPGGLFSLPGLACGEIAKMIIKASGHSALVLAAGLFVCVAGPLQAATGADESDADSKSQNAAAAPAKLHTNLRHGLHHGKSYAHGKFHRVALKANAGTKAPATETLADASKTLSDIPPSVANANAQFPSAGILGEHAKLMTARASDLLQGVPDDSANPRAETLLVAADQLNDVDRALREGNSLSATPANPPPAPAAASSGESSTWDQTSLIGKIFIGFGALLTMFSAARMFMA
jgi:hypothetical protein